MFFDLTLTVAVCQTRFDSSYQFDSLICQIWQFIPNQTEIATEEFCPKSLLRKQNKIDFIESRFQILHHFKIVHWFFNLATYHLKPIIFLGQQF